MKAKYATSGATLILVVLFTLLLMSLVLAATMRLGLTSRQNTGDQKATLQAQYAAESNLALIRSQLQDWQKILSANSIVVPTTLSKETLLSWAEKYCGQSGTSAWTKTGVDKILAHADLLKYEEAEQCGFVAGTATDRYVALANLIPAGAYQILPSAERPTDTSVNGLQSWWSGKMATDQVVGAGKFQVIPTRVVKLNNNAYRFYLGVGNVTAEGATAVASRKMEAQKTVDGQWWFQIELPSLLDDVLMTNHHRSGPSIPVGEPDIFFANDQTFDGGVFTNEKFVFANSSKAQFLDSVSSVGCTNLPDNGIPSGGDCTSTSGVFTGTSSSSLSAWKETDAGAVTSGVNPYLRDKVLNATSSNVNFTQQPNFEAKYKALPTSSADQQADATSAGLVLPSDSLGVDLFAGNSSGENLSTATYSNKKWTEPSPTYQYISFKKREYTTTSWTQTSKAVYDATPATYRYRTSSWSGYTYYVRPSTIKVDNDNRYRISNDGTMYKYDATAKAWPTSAFRTTKFNGVIYGSNISSVTGPARIAGGTSGDVSKSPPALASFSKITLASEGDINIESDLTMSDTPCGLAASKSGACVKNPMPTNVLGIYSQAGDVSIATTAPDDVNLQATMLAATGKVQVTNYNSGGTRGTATVTGAIIENWYGAFGTFNGTTPKSGYQRNFTYDKRLREGIAPPSFPVSPTWNKDDGYTEGKRLDSLLWKQGTK